MNQHAARTLRTRRLAVWCAAVVLLAAAGLVAVAYWAVHRVPDYYRQRLEIDPQQAQRQSDALLSKAATLVSEVQQRRSWSMTFTEEEINGFLAVDLVEKHADLLPPEISQPRIAILPEGIRLACRWQGRLDTVLSLEVDVYLAEENVVALRLRGAKAGVVPMPLADVLEAVRTAAENLELQVRWRQADGDPVALITVPPTSKGKPLRLEALQLETGKLRVAVSAGPER